jgi:muramoyltetrapeptide carboxypeptidase
MPHPPDRIVPPPLREGSRVLVVAPSGPFDQALVLAGIAELQGRYRVSFDSGIFDRLGFLAGSDERRLGELEVALRDPTLDAVVMARGGYGLLRIAHRIEWGALRRAPKWLVGFSDTTTLHLEALRVGVATLHADNAGGLGRGGARAFGALSAALESDVKGRVHSGLVTVAPGIARGPLVGGNLTLIAFAAAAGRLSLPDGAVLLLEDVTEAAYRIDRMLTALAVGGHLDRLGGVVLGDFTDCPASSGVETSAVLAERLLTLRIPVASGLRAGHGAVNEPIVLGTDVVLDATQGTLSFL